jgi:NADH:ubiquinone oxidoreductase subunit D
MYVCKYEVALIIMNADYFEIHRLTEDLAKLYSTACATSWFKIAGVKRPSQEEFRHKVVEFMKHFEYTLDSFPQTPAANQFREQARKSLEKEIAKVLAGENKDVEKRYKYYVDYS